MASANNSIYPLFHWVTESTSSHKINGITVQDHIARLFDSVGKVIKKPTILFRAHTSDNPTIRSTSWFATASDEAKVRRQHISEGTDCCLFKITVCPGIRVIPVDNALQHAGYKRTHYDESEILVEGGGTFVTSLSTGVGGFIDSGINAGVQVYSSFYIPKKTSKSVDAKTIFKRISSDEFDFYTEISDLKSASLLHTGETVDDSVWHEVLLRIKRNSNSKSNSSRKSKSSRKSNSSKS